MVNKQFKPILLQYVQLYSIPPTCVTLSMGNYVAIFSRVKTLFNNDINSFVKFVDLLSVWFEGISTCYVTSGVVKFTRIYSPGNIPRKIPNLGIFVE